MADTPKHQGGYRRPLSEVRKTASGLGKRFGKLQRDATRRLGMNRDKQG